MSLEEMGKNTRQLGTITMTIAVVLIILSKFGQVSGITTAANTAVNSAITAVDDFIDWFSIIVLLIVVVFLFKQQNKAMG